MSEYPIEGQAGQDAPQNESGDPLIREPGRIPGFPPRKLSPNEYVTLTEVLRPQPAIRPDWHMKEEKIEAINSDGIERFGMRFMAAELMKLTTGKASDHHRWDLRIRYDEGLLARGLLDSFDLYRKTDDGYEPLCTCYEDSLFWRIHDRVKLAKERAAFETAQSETVEAFQEEYRILINPSHYTDAFNEARHGVQRRPPPDKPAAEADSLDAARERERQEIEDQWRDLAPAETKRPRPETGADEEEDAQVSDDPADLLGGETKIVSDEEHQNPEKEDHE
jgi:hypothetical protein